MILHQTSDHDNNDDLKDMLGEDWIDMSILDGKIALDIGAMDSGLIFNHDNEVSMGSMNTKAYMIKNNMAGTSDKNVRITVFAATKKYSTTPMEQDKSP